MQLKRDAGRIVDASNNNRPIILVGGHYYLFQKEGKGDYGLDIDGQPTPVIWYPRKNEMTFEPCQKDPNTRVATPRLWPADFQLLFTRMRESRNNLLRIFLTNSYVADDLFPYNTVGNKLAVQDAVQNGRWNEAYFSRLLSFAQKADSYGIALQLSVFNFFDFAAWDLSPWNPLRASDITQGWSTQHLVSTGGNPAGRCAAFMDVTNTKLTLVKQAFINKLVNTLRGQGNIIFELMNEPRGPQGTQASYQAKFLSQVAGLLIAAFGSWRPLLSVNAAPPMPLAQSDINTVLDIDAWQAGKATLPHYDAIDLVSYHGISGMTAPETTCGTAGVSFPFVDNDSIVQRTQKHLPKFPDKAMMYSTDGVFAFEHRFIGGKMTLRDGQIWNSLKNDTAGVPPFNQRHHSDLGNWAYWCLRQAFANPGRCHFQNHSSYDHSIIYIQDSYAKAQGTSTGTGFTPPFAAPQWTTWQWRSIPPNDFNVAVNFKPNIGEIIVQLGTVANPADAAQAGAAEVGFLRMFNATSNKVRVEALYSPTSVTVRSTGATVIPAVALRLHAVDPSGNVGALIARQAVTLQPRALPGQIVLTATVAAGQRYALILAADVGVQYQNRWQGYGEIIVSYQRATLIM